MAGKIKREKTLKIIFLLAILGILVSSYLTYIYYSEKYSSCELSETFSCSAVSKSQYGEILGIPVSLFGIVGYLILAMISSGNHQQ